MTSIPSRFRLILSAAVIGSVAVLSAASAGATTIDRFKKTTNDGVYALTDAQATLFGVEAGSYIGFFRVREGSGTSFSEGDSFDRDSILASVTSGVGNILGAADDKRILNGRNAALGYAGSFFDDLGTTTIGTPNSYYEGVAFLFDGDRVTFRGSSTFAADQSRGDFDGVGLPEPAPVPLPAPAALLLAGLGGLALLRRRQRA